MIPLLVGAGLLRVMIQAMFPDLGPFLDNRVEVSTPVSSFKRLQECVYLYDHGIPVYTGDMCFQSPLLVSLFNVLGTKSGLLLNSVYALVDSFAAYQLAQICKARPKFSTTANSAALVYMLNPLNLAGSIAKSTNTFSNAWLLGALAAAQLGNPAQAMVYLALAAVLGWYPLFYLLPVLVLANKNTFRHFKLWKLCVLFILAAGTLLGLSYAMGGRDFLKIYAAQVLFTDMTRPNLGLWWYFFIELFAVFRPFFMGMFQMFIGSFPIPLSIRFPDDPVFVTSLTAGILTIAKPYPEISDVGFFLSTLTLNVRVLELMKFKSVVALGLLYVCALAPTFYHLWIYVGSGNANFFYAITLVHSLTLALCVCDMLWAAIRLDYDGGRATNLIQI